MKFPDHVLHGEVGDPPPHLTTTVGDIIVTGVILFLVGSACAVMWRHFKTVRAKKRLRIQGMGD